MPASFDQAAALEQLCEIERYSDGTIDVRVVPATAAGDFVVELSIACDGFERAGGGLPLRARELFFLRIPADFPFRPPTVFVRHARFAQFEHVQWTSSLCMYQSPETEWHPGDGMFGFVTRLLEWLKRGALNDFEPAGVPLHPPAVYVNVAAAGIVVPRASAPVVEAGPWLGLVDLAVVHEKRVDIVNWLTASFSVAPGHRAGAGILLPDALPFEYPTKVADLLDRLAAQGIERGLVLLVLLRAVLSNPKETPLHVVIGSPMRGVSGSAERVQHLAAWCIQPWLADGFRLLANQFSDSEELRTIGGDVERIVLEWAAEAAIDWCSVREARAEVTRRRDQGTPAAFFAGKSAAIWGCGALGGRVAEFLARAGIRKLVLRDGGIVAPGVLVRQPFRDHDIGYSKAHGIAALVRAIDPRIEVEVHPHDLLAAPLASDNWTDGVDVIFDMSASLAVHHMIERRRAESPALRAPIVSMVVDHWAQRGLLVVVGTAHTGGPADVSRRVKFEVCRRAELRSFAEAFWPRGARHPVFQPEPGCSASTFVGSAADLATLAGGMLNLAAQDLARASANETSGTATGHVLAQPHVTGSEHHHVAFAFGPDVVNRDPSAGYEIRIAPGAWADIEGWIARAGRTLGPNVETGGILFGERNDASRVIWIDEVVGPPPDSTSSRTGFVCGTAGAHEANAEKRHRTRGSVAFIGMWHTHPDCPPLPSPTDRAGMAQIIAQVETTIPKAVLLIVGTSGGKPTGIGTFVFSRRDFDQADDEVGSSGREADRQAERTQGEIRAAPAPAQPKKIGLALSGGGSRAIAFHLGCLRALQDRGILDQVEVLSTVSGGSVIGALYAYSEGDFATFDARVQELLRRGLVGSLIHRTFFSGRFFASVFTTATANAVALSVSAIRLAARLLPANIRRSLERLQPPFRRWHTRTTAFEVALDRSLFDGTRLDNVRRGNRHGRLGVVINATELRTGTAFRFGSNVTGASRLGVVSEPLPVALAVAASAAYPALLPALDLELEFQGRDGKSARRRVLLTDGGVYENLGTACMEPGRSDEVSTHVHVPDYIIACDAGAGVVDGSAIPYWWPTRMLAAFETVFRRVQNDTRRRLHGHVASGDLKGFVMPYLGQFDGNLPRRPPDLVLRENVVDYPTDFSPMSEENIELLSQRGEQLTRLLISQHAPGL